MQSLPIRQTKKNRLLISAWHVYIEKTKRRRKHKKDVEEAIKKADTATKEKKN